MTHTEIQASVQKTATFTGASIDVSALGASWTIKLQVSQLTAAALARFSIEDTSDGGTSFFAGPTWAFKGEIESTYDKVHSVKAQDFPDLITGAAGNKLRLHLTDLTASASVTYHAWIES